MKLKVLDLFSGIGGFSLGLERTGGFETVAFCEIEDYPRRVLEKNWPGVEIHNDITRLKYRKNVDLVTAGFPCQDISLAGQGAGLSGERSGLFWYILRTLCMVGRPRALLENVGAVLVRGLSTILGALASFGYDAEWHCIPASAVGSTQNRDRAWIIANPGENGEQRFLESLDTGAIRQGRSCRQEDLQQVYANPLGGDSWPEPLVRGGRGGFPDWSHRIGALGNTVDPAIPELIGRSILSVEGMGNE